MADDLPAEAAVQHDPQPDGARRRRWPRWLAWTAGIAAVLLFLLALAAVVLDSGAGRRFITDQIEALQPENGLRIRVGRIEGSIYRNAVLRDVRLYDPKGLFLRVPEARLDWRPLDFLLRNRLTIHALDAPRADLARLPELKQTGKQGPILPDFDIVIGRLRVDRLQLGEAIAGQPHVATLSGRADIRSGTADVDLDARLLDGGDRVKLDLLAAPDRGDFDINADLVAPRGGVLTALMGSPRGVTGVIRGQGNWDRWQGSLLADSDGAALARLRLTAAQGRYTASGRLRPDLVTSGFVQRVTRGGVALDVDGRFADRVWNGRAALVGEAVQLDTQGEVDLARNSFGGLRVDAWVRRPASLLDDMDGQNVRLATRFDGAFDAPRVEYLLTAPWLSFGKTRLTGIEARGHGIADKGTFQVPLNLRVATITGLGDMAEGIVRDLTAQGVLQFKDMVLTSNLIRVRSRGLDGRVTLLANFRTGDYLAGFDGALPGLEIDGLGRVDLLTDMDVRRRADGAFGIVGTARATMRRLDNSFIRTLTGGLPVVNTNLSIGADGVVHFTNLRVASPLLTLTGQGMRRADGTFQLSGRGVHRTYGPVIVTLDGPIERPRVDLRLASPLASAQLSDVHVQLLPTAEGFSFTAAGGSILGPFEGNGRILLPSGGATVIAVDRLAVGGTTASGRLTVVDGGMAGTLAVAGGGLDGSIVLSVPNGIQRIAVNLTARDARFAGPPPIVIRRGQVQATILLDPQGTDVDATFEGAGISRGTLSIARVAGNARLVDGRGTVRGSLAGARGRDFTFQFVADVADDAYRLRGQGTLGRQPLTLTRPAVIRRERDLWRLEPTELSYGGGTARVSGEFGGSRLRIDAGLNNLPLSLLDIGWPTLNLGGRASGRLGLEQGAGAPTGTAELRLTNFTRSGLTDSGTPLDIGINAALSQTSGAVRAVINRNGQTMGRIQARVSPLPAEGALFDRIANAPLTGGLRYNGEAGMLWHLIGIDAFSLSGPVSIAADVHGRLADPQIRGAMRAQGARFESYNTGTVITNVSAIGHFDGSRLQLRDISGQTPDGGTVTGAGDFNLSAANGFGMDVRLQANRALLIQRDDLVARVTGPARIFSDGNGGTISGTMTLDEGSFRLGQATSAEALPVINVVEVNAPADRPQPRAASAPWNLNIRVNGRNNFHVTGLGLDSEWSANVAVRGPVSDFSITGVARLVRGEYAFAGRRFELESGTIRFTGDTVDPVLDIVAVDDISGIDAQIRVRGTGLRPEITFTSNPQLPEDELLSRILFGSSVTDISVTEAAQLGLALASLRGGEGLDPINAIRRATGLDRLRILPANTEIGAGTSIAAGKYITRRVFVEIITDGQGYSATRVEYQVTRWLSILGAISTLNDESVNARVKRDY
jgi:translocation and assembly module TamB